MKHSNTLHRSLNATVLVAAYAVFTLASGTIYAQGSAKQELASKIAALQQGPEMDRMLQQIAASASQPLVANWGPRLQNLPEAKQKQVSDSMNAELQKFDKDALKILSSKVNKVSSDHLVAAYMEKFSEDELKQLAGMLEAPVFKKYQSVSPELGNTFVQKLIDASRPEIETRAKAFDAAATKIVGAAPAPAAPAKK